MKRLILLSPLVLAACVPQPQTCGTVEPAPIIFTKEGFPIMDDQAPIPVPCDVITVTILPDPPQTPPDTPETPVDDPHDPFMPKGNNGWGNGNQDAPGGSEFNNGAENTGGNRNGKPFAPAKSWHES